MATNLSARGEERSELAEALGRCRSGLIGVGIASAVLNVLVLGGSIFMMLVYDMVLPSRSGATLIGLLVMIIVIYVFQGMIDVMRSRMLMQIGASLDVSMSRRIHDLIGMVALRARPGGDGLQPMRDLDSIRTFISGGGPAALIDLPWMFFFIAVLFLLHPYLGLTALVGALILIGLTIATDRMSRRPTSVATQIAAARNNVAETARRNAEVIYALGMRARVEATWHIASYRFIAAQQRLADIAGTLGGVSKFFRLLLQSLVLAVGAFLVIDGKATGGVIFASSILTSRALAPVELAIANWRGFLGARQAWERLTALLKAAPEPRQSMELPAPTQLLSVEGLTLSPPGSGRVTVQDATFQLKAGDSLAVIGPSASGKSSMVRGIVGVWQPMRGKVRLDGAALDQWDSDSLGRHIGYLPQQVDLLDGTVAENIARFHPDPAPGSVIEAAQRAGVHDLIVRMPNGYDTQVGADGESLSAGQRQRVALARALYGDPFLIVLDEPNSNLDAEGEQALVNAINWARQNGRIIILVAHRPSMLAAVDRTLFLRDGRIQDFGPKDEVLGRVLNQQKGGRGRLAPVPAPVAEGAQE